MNTDRNTNLLLKQAISKLGNHDYHGAIELFDQLIESNPNHLMALQGRMFCKTLLIDHIGVAESAEFLMIDIPNDLTQISTLIESLPDIFKR